MKQASVQEENRVSVAGSSGSPRGSSEAPPQRKYSINQGNGMLALDISLYGPLECPPFLARMYCRNGRRGRFRINLKEEKLNSGVRLSGQVNVRCGDIIEWRNKSIKNLGFIDENGRIIKLNPGSGPAEFHEKLKKYLKTRDKQYIVKHLAKPGVNNRPGEIERSKV